MKKVVHIQSANNLITQYANLINNFVLFVYIFKQSNNHLNVFAAIQVRTLKKTNRFNSLGLLFFNCMLKLENAPDCFLLLVLTRVFTLDSFLVMGEDLRSPFFCSGDNVTPVKKGQTGLKKVQ